MASISTPRESDRGDFTTQGPARAVSGGFWPSGTRPAEHGLLERGGWGRNDHLLGRRQGIGEHLRRSPIPQDLPGPAVDPLFHRPNLGRRHLTIVYLFRKVRAYQAVGMLVQASFPRVVRGGKIEVSPEAAAISRWPANSLPLSAVQVCTRSRIGPIRCPMASFTVLSGCLTHIFISVPACFRQADRMTPFRYRHADVADPGLAHG